MLHALTSDKIARLVGSKASGIADKQRAGHRATRSGWVPHALDVVGARNGIREISIGTLRTTSCVHCVPLAHGALRASRDCGMRWARYNASRGDNGPLARCLSFALRLRRHGAARLNARTIQFAPLTQRVSIARNRLQMFDIALGLALHHGGVPLARVFPRNARHLRRSGGACGHTKFVACIPLAANVGSTC